MNILMQRRFWVNSLDLKKKKILPFTARSYGGRMPKFMYVAKESNGHTVKGEIDGADKKHVLDLLRSKNLLILKLEKSIESLQESFDYLRVCIKYQCFDLEATKRENQYLRGLLDEKNN